MSYVFGVTQSWVKQQRKTFVVFNSFVPYDPTTDIPTRAHKKNFWANPEYFIQRVTTRPFEAGTPLPPPVQSGDVFSGHDTYGWPPPPDPWWQTQRGYYLRYTNSFLYDPTTDAPRFAKRVPFFGAYQEYSNPSRDPQLWQPAFLTFVTVPDVTAMDIAAATVLLGNAGLIAQVTGSVYDPVIPLNAVVSQTPVGGQQALLGASIALIISLGPQPAPPFVGITLPEAIRIAVNADLIVAQPVVWQYNAVVPYNYVISQDPAAGTVVKPMSIVKFVASLGPAPTINPNIVPNVVGLMILDAQNAISAAGCNPVNPAFSYSTTVPSGYVISQSLVAGTIVTYGTAVAVLVSVGPPVTLETGNSIVIPVMH